MTLMPTIDELACSGHGDCAAIAPEAFRVDGTAVVIGTAPEELLRAAAEACPALAIALVEGETGATAYP